MASSEAWGGFRNVRVSKARRGQEHSPGSDISVSSFRSRGRHRYWKDPSIPSLSPTTQESQGDVLLSPQSSPRDTSRSHSPNQTDMYYRNSRRQSPKSFRSVSPFSKAGYSSEHRHGISDKLKAAMQAASQGGNTIIIL